MAKKVDLKTLESVAEQANYAVDETQRLEAQDARIIEWVVEKFVEKDYLDALEGAIINQLGGIGVQVMAAEKLIDDVMNAMNGPNATVDSIKEMFWLLNDIIEKLMAATGVEITP